MKMYFRHKKSVLTTVQQPPLILGQEQIKNENMSNLHLSNSFISSKNSRFMS